MLFTGTPLQQKYWSAAGCVYGCEFVPVRVSILTTPNSVYFYSKSVKSQVVSNPSSHLPVFLSCAICRWKGYFHICFVITIGFIYIHFLYSYNILTICVCITQHKPSSESTMPHCDYISQMNVSEWLFLCVAGVWSCAAHSIALIAFDLQLFKHITMTRQTLNPHCITLIVCQSCCVTDETMDTCVHGEPPTSSQSLVLMFNVCVLAEWRRSPQY